MCRMVWLHIRQPQPFTVQLSGLINFAALTGQIEWASEFCRLTYLFFMVKNYTWSWGWRKQSLRAALTRALHMALPQHCLLFCLGKKIWDISSLKPADPRVLCCISSESSAQCEHFLPSEITVLLLLVKIAWHTSQQLYRIAVHLYSCENRNKKMAQLFFSPAEN